LISKWGCLGGGSSTTTFPARGHGGKVGKVTNLVTVGVHRRRKVLVQRKPTAGDKRKL